MGFKGTVLSNVTRDEIMSLIKILHDAINEEVLLGREGEDPQMKSRRLLLIKKMEMEIKFLKMAKDMESPLCETGLSVMDETIKILQHYAKQGAA